jgi:ATP-dependent DNA helicase RecQ
MEMTDLIIKKAESYENALIVYKGMDQVDNEWSLKRISENKFKYFGYVNCQSTPQLAYDQYLLIRDFVLLQYKFVLIFDNNIFFNQYPAGAWLDDYSVEKLVEHFDEEMSEDNIYEDSIQPFLEVYSNVLKVEDRLYFTYNQFLSDSKEIVFNIHEDKIDLPVEDFVEGYQTVDILTETDYLRMTQILDEAKVKNIQVIYENIGFSEELVLGKIALLRKIYSDIAIKVVHNPGNTSTEILPDTYDILKNYWGASEFRTINMYDLNEVKNGVRKVVHINQGEIITMLINQVEACRENRNYRDMFVTAPTGSGKSAIFQIPAIYIAEKYELFTLVISPLIGLMKDQVQGLISRNYPFARTINSDISPIVKQEIISEIAECKCHILYLSPESLMGKSDLVNIIGERTLGLLVIDEAHIVTTWGKQFRPDYWYLGDHISKLRKAQHKRANMQFVMATFTATAIYGGLENMYQETLQSLNMFDPITYLGYVKREDIEINVEKKALVKNRVEYELDKFTDLVGQIERALMLDKKALIYFPTVALIERFYTHCLAFGLADKVARYHGQMNATMKEENYQQYLTKEKAIMIATKAFGMGIDIDDIELVLHYAPTGNVCDYLQEIGRAARRTTLDGEAYYQFMSNDFQHINRLHGLSTIRKYQLIEVIEKIHNLHEENIKQDNRRGIKSKRNSMLVDAESFSHIFENPFFDHDDGINKVKTALLLIQKDFERTMSFSPFYVKPIPLFETGYFMMNRTISDKINKSYNSCCQLEDKLKGIYSVNLKTIWEKKFKQKYTFPQFKYLLYVKDSELDFKFKHDLENALSINVNFENNYEFEFDKVFDSLKNIMTTNARLGSFISIDEIVGQLVKGASISKYAAASMVEVLIVSINIFKKEFNQMIGGRIFSIKVLKNNTVKYSFDNGISNYFRWLKGQFIKIREEIKDDTLYVVKSGKKDIFKEKLTALGVFESMGILNFKALGGSNSQLYIYVNQTKTLKEIINNPGRYNNRLLELVGQRHQLSVMMLTHLFDNDLPNESCWDIIEDYFLGKIPDAVRIQFKKEVGYELPQGV